MQTYIKDTHGSVIGLAGKNGAKLDTKYDYDAFGNQLYDEPNPFGYCGEYYDSESGNIYLRARYYDSNIGRFVSEDPVKDGMNWYSYCGGNPVSLVDPSGMTSEEDAAKIIENNAYAIIHAGEYYNVNPAIIAACIYAEQVLNVNWVDEVTDIIGYAFDTSIGIGQVRISTAKLVEDTGYIAKTELTSVEYHWIGVTMIWSTPGAGDGEMEANSREEAIAYRLTSESENINYVASYLAYWQDRWKGEYSDIDGDTAVLATLYNQGERQPPHSNPKSNDFGKYAKEQYYYMRKLLGLD